MHNTESESNAVNCAPVGNEMSAYEGFPGGPAGKESDCSEGDRVQLLGWEDPLEEEMATHSSILA